MKSQTLTEAYALQHLAFDMAMKLKGDLESAGNAEARVRVTTALAQATRAWETCVERARIIRGRPLPGSLRPVKPAGGRRRMEVSQPTTEPPPEPTSEPEPEAEAEPTGGEAV